MIMKEPLLLVILVLMAGGLAFTLIPRQSYTACTLEAKLCPDGSYVGRTGPNCEFAACPSEPGAVYCTSESRNADACITLYKPVCGWFSPEVQCIRYSCAQTYSNSCFACQNNNVLYYTEGQCPTG